MARDFKEVWFVDFEFRAPDGENPEPRCMVAYGLHSKTLKRIWLQGIKGGQSPVDLGDESLYVAYYASAEMGCHLSLDWPLPENLLDLFVEFRVHMNGFNPQGGFGLLGAMSSFGLGHMAPSTKDSMRELAMREGDYTAEEKEALMDYCEEDVRSLVVLYSKMSHLIDLERALLRGRYMSSCAQVERNGIPIDTDLFRRLNHHWDEIRSELISEVDKTFGVFEENVFKRERFLGYLKRNGIPWPLLDSGTPRMDDETFGIMSLRYPEISPLKDLRSSLSKMRLKDLSVGQDGRNRTLLSAFRSRTGRNQPSSSRFIFGASSWLRGLVQPGEGMSLVYIDWSQQEYGIAAALSGDERMLSAYRSGDPYLAFAIQAGQAPEGATKKSHKGIRDQFKAAVLAVQYGMGAESLAMRIGESRARGRELLQMHRDAYPVFWRWSDAAVDKAMIEGRLKSVFSWEVGVSSDSNPRSLRNFPMQANGAEMMRIAMILLTQDSIRVCAPVHDAFLIESETDCLDETIERVREHMRTASRMVLGGFELESEAEVSSYPDRFGKPGRGSFFSRVAAILEKIGGAISEGTPLHRNQGRRVHPSYSLYKESV